jgi:hypothetical protein
LANYNENKVKEGNGAYTSAAGNYPINAKRLLFDRKLNRLLKHLLLMKTLQQTAYIFLSISILPTNFLMNN